jgi:hypothetical protein
MNASISENSSLSVLSVDAFLVLLVASNLLCSAHISQHRSDVNGVCGVCAKKTSYIDYCKLDAEIIGLE